MSNFREELRKIANNEKWTDDEKFEAVNELHEKYVAEAVKLFDTPIVSVPLPTKDKACKEGYRIANDAGYNYRRVLNDQDHDIYYSGWMDCFDWINSNER